MGWFESAINTAANAVTFSPGVALTGAALGYDPTKESVISRAFGGQQSENGIPLYGANAAARNADMEAGYAKGKEIFYDDPDMQDLRKRRMDLSKGYNSKELGAMRSQAQNEIQGQRSNYLRALAGKTAKAGIGGARAAAMQASADKGFQQNAAEMQRKMLLDQSNQVQKGTDSLQDFLMRQKYGMLGTGLGYGQLGVADRSADAQARIASQEQDRGIAGNFLKPIFG